MRVLIDGTEAFSVVQDAIVSAQHSVHIAGWHSSPDFTLTPGGAPLRDLLARAAERVPVRLLMWGGPPLPVFQPTRAQTRAARDGFVRDSGVEVVLDTRERTLHCHHEKVVVVDDRIAVVGGIDLTALAGDRLDAPGHPKAQDLGWHDCACVLEGPVVTDVADHFRARWDEVARQRLPAPEPQPRRGDVAVQLLRTVPNDVYRFLPDGEFSILAAYLQALRSARSFVYLENQFLWSAEVADVLIDKLEHPPTDDFRILLVLPRRPDNGKDTTRGQLGRLLAADAGRGRLLATTLLGPTADSPGVYVHAKVGIVDDRWLTLGSANLNEHSLFNDTEVNVLTLDEDLARSTRLRLWSEHLGRPEAELAGPVSEVVDQVWLAQCTVQDRVSADGRDPVHSVRRLDHLSRRVDRLRGALDGLLVDG